MECETCRENYIKYNNNCYEIKNSSKKSFYDPEIDDKESSCFEKFKLYIKEDSNECIPLPDENEGYYISNTETGVLSKCHENCFTCKSSSIINEYGNLISMECLECKNSKNSEKHMIKVENNSI